MKVNSYHHVNGFEPVVSNLEGWTFQLVLKYLLEDSYLFGAQDMIVMILGKFKLI